MCLLLAIFRYIPPYLLFICLSFLISSIVLLAFMYRERLINKSLPKYIITILISIYVGALLFSVLSLIINDVVNNNCKDVIKIITNGRYGLVYYGGLTGCVITTYVFVKLNLISRIIYDILAFVIPLFHSITRIGCYFAGCCYGVNHDALLQMPMFDNGVFTGKYCVPTQLFESFFEITLAIFLLMLYIENFKRFNLLKMYILFYAVFRYFNEFLRADEIRGVYFGLSFSQYFSLLIVLTFLYQKYIKTKYLRRNYK